MRETLPSAMKAFYCAAVVAVARQLQQPTGRVESRHERDASTIVVAATWVGRPRALTAQSRSRIRN
jgi:hypothetical protein